MNCYKSDIAALISQFQSCTLPREQWTHPAHLKVAFWYLMQEPLLDAVRKIRSGIQRYNTAQGIAMTPTSGYHETLTLFWISLVYQYLEQHNLEQHREGGFITLLNGLLETYADPQLPLQYYSRDRLMSWEARTRWVEPDLQPLPFIEFPE